MEVGAPVWVRNDALCWIAGTIEEKVPDPSDTNCVVLTVATTSGAQEISVPAGQSDAENCKLRNVSDGSVDSVSDADVHDLIHLMFLHEPAILHALHRRFERGTIYTNTGPILIAVNPFKQLPLYTEEVLQQYLTEASSAGFADSHSPHAPHVFQVANTAYRQMSRAMAAKASADSTTESEHINQSVLVSGESGAGKTETTKFVMRFLATAGGVSGSGTNGGDSIATRVLQSNPILEAFGNACTIRNHNSSRFGKFIEMCFDGSGGLVGATIQTYLLEKVRLASHAARERSFHIFYQLARGLEADTDGEGRAQALRLELGLGSLEEYAFACRADGETRVAHPDLDDARDWLELRAAMKTLHFSDQAQAGSLRVVAALMHLGNVVFEVKEGAVDGDAECAREETTAVALRTAAALLAVDAEGLERAMCTRHLKVGGQNITVLLKVEQAADARDALAKALYSQLFDFLVTCINRGVRPAVAAAPRSPTARSPSNRVAATGFGSSGGDRRGPSAFIGLLDIFGFEHFERNSFEQLCINYCNEKLQAHFNNHIFKAEQAEYEREDIQWFFIDFPDNKDTLQLIEQKPMGLLALLDSECLFPQQGGDASLARKYYQHLGKHARFFRTSKDEVHFRFGVKHYAADVTYSTSGFLEKNRDSLPAEGQKLLQASTDHFICSLMPRDGNNISIGKEAGARGRAAMDLVKQTVSARDAIAARAGLGARAIHTTRAGQAQRQGPVVMSGAGSTAAKASGRANSSSSSTLALKFKGQLNQLMLTITATAPHYIRCLKPNDENVPDYIDRERLVAQLRYSGVLEAVRVARAGYPVRRPHHEFVRRYRALAPQPHAAAVQNAMHVGGARAGDGRTSAQLLLDVIDLGAVGLEKAEQVQMGLTKVFMRKEAFEWIEAELSRLLRRCSVTIQSIVRARQYRRQFVARKLASLRLQAIARGQVGRTLAQQARRARAALFLQKHVRRWLAQECLGRAIYAVNMLQARLRGAHGRREARKRWRQRQSAAKLRSAVTTLQSLSRARAARQTLRALRADARDVAKVRKLLEEAKATIQEKNIELEQERRGRETAERSYSDLLQDQQGKNSEDVEPLLHRIKDLEHFLQLEQRKNAALQEKLSKLTKASQLQASNVHGADDSEDGMNEYDESGEYHRLLQEERKLRKSCKKDAEAAKVRAERAEAELQMYKASAEKGARMQIALQQRFGGDADASVASSDDLSADGGTAQHELLSASSTASQSNVSAHDGAVVPPFTPRMGTGAVVQEAAEFDVSFGEGKLGINIDAAPSGSTDGMPVVTSVVEGGLAHCSGVEVGMSVVRTAGQPTFGVPHQEVAARVAAGARPLVVRFHVPPALRQRRRRQRKSRNSGSRQPGASEHLSPRAPASVEDQCSPSVSGTTSSLSSLNMMVQVFKMRLERDGVKVLHHTLPVPGSKTEGVESGKENGVDLPQRWLRLMHETDANGHSIPTLVLTRRDPKRPVDSAALSEGGKTGTSRARRRSSFGESIVGAFKSTVGAIKKKSTTQNIVEKQRAKARAKRNKGQGAAEVTAASTPATLLSSDPDVLASIPLVRLHEVVQVTQSEMLRGQQRRNSFIRRGNTAGVAPDELGAMFAQGTDARCCLAIIPREAVTVRAMGRSAGFVVPALCIELESNELRDEVVSGLRELRTETLRHAAADLLFTPQRLPGQGVPGQGGTRHGPTTSESSNTTPGVPTLRRSGSIDSMSLAELMRSSGLDAHEVASSGSSQPSVAVDSSNDGENCAPSGDLIQLNSKQLRELLLQREHQDVRHQRLVVQMCDATNELNEREELLKLQEKEIEQLKLNADEHDKVESMGMKLAKKLQLMLIENQKLRKEKVRGDELQRRADELQAKNEQLAHRNVELCQKVAESEEDVLSLRRAHMGMDVSSGK